MDRFEAETSKCVLQIQIAGDWQVRSRHSDFKDAIQEAVNLLLAEPGARVRIVYVVNLSLSGGEA